jgi:hypothetical protein
MSDSGGSSQSTNSLSDETDDVQGNSPKHVEIPLRLTVSPREMNVRRKRFISKVDNFLEFLKLDTIQFPRQTTGREKDKFLLTKDESISSLKSLRSQLIMMGDQATPHIPNPKRAEYEQTRKDKLLAYRKIISNKMSDIRKIYAIGNYQPYNNIDYEVLPDGHPMIHEQNSTFIDYPLLWPVTQTEVMTPLVRVNEQNNPIDPLLTLSNNYAVINYAEPIMIPTMFNQPTQFEYDIRSSDTVLPQCPDRNKLQ